MSSPTLASNPNPLAAIANRDLLAQLLSDKRSPNTRHAYAKDLKDFFRTIADSEATPEMVTYFLQLERTDAVTLVLRYKAMLIERGLKEATINRRLSAIKSLVKLARSAGKCDYTLEEVKGEKVQVYRDTAGISRELYRKVLALPDRVELKGKRDYALLRLLWDNALRRGEIAKANIGDFDAEAKTLKIRGKGKGTVFEVIDLSLTTTEAIRDWLLARRELNTSAPLFISVDPVKKGNRITGAGIYWIVQQYCRAAGVSKQMSPHRIRHSSITAALDATNGNVRKVQKLSRHAQIDTLMVYDDNRSKDQLEISTLLADMV
ncbi:MAG: tyrosine-type recombinase/integrase [Symploca sp. SIO1B1]|nr:tyrosine-type recombinase/integrase [Symploca sp. SIO1B1]